MDLKLLSEDNIYKEELISILEILDDDTRDDETTSDMSRELFISDNKTVTDKEALKIFYENITDNCIVALQNNSVLGFSCVKKNDDFFDDVEEYYPHIAVTYSAVKPAYQQKGIWTNIRTYIEENNSEIYSGAEYIVSAVSENNIPSQNANEKLGMNIVAELDYGDELTYVYAKSIFK